MYAAATLTLILTLTQASRGYGPPFTKTGIFSGAIYDPVSGECTDSRLALFARWRARQSAGAQSLSGPACSDLRANHTSKGGGAAKYDTRAVCKWRGSPLRWRRRAEQCLTPAPSSTTAQLRALAATRSCAMSRRLSLKRPARVLFMRILQCDLCYISLAMSFTLIQFLERRTSTLVCLFFALLSTTCVLSSPTCEDATRMRTTFLDRESILVRCISTRICALNSLERRSRRVWAEEVGKKSRCCGPTLL